MHGIEGIIAINANAATQARLNAADPGRKQARAAEDDLNQALDNLVAALAPVINGQAGSMAIAAAHTGGIVKASSPFPPLFSIVWNGEEAWVLPLNTRGLQAADKAIPPGTRRYGLHYILEGEAGLAIAHSLAQMS